MKLRTHLLLLVLAVLVPAGIGSAIALTYVYVEQHDFAEASMRETTQALTQVLDREIAHREETLRMLRLSPSLQRDDLSSFATFAREVARGLGTRVLLSDADGRLLLDTAADLALPLDARLPLPLPSALPKGAEIDASSVSDAFRIGDGPLSFALQVPVDRHLNRLLLTMVLPTTHLQPILHDQELPRGWLGSVIDRQGVVVARSLDPDRFVGTRSRPALLERIRSEPHGFHRGTTLDGKPSSAFFRRAQQSGWTMVVSVPRDLMEGTATRGTLLLGALGALLLGLSLTAAWLLARRITGPIEALALDAARLGRQQPVALKHTPIPELDAVMAALARASERLEQNAAEREQRVQEAVRKYEHSQRALVQAQKLDALGRLTGGIAHDFNNVLQTLSTGLQAAAKAGPERLPALIAVCQRAVERGSTLARQLMAFGRAQELHVITIDPATRLAETRPMLANGLPSNISLEWRAEPRLWPVTVDPTQLELALLNLVLNARDAMPRGGAIRLLADNISTDDPPDGLAPGDYLRLSVVDEGLGMSEDVRSRALDPFFTTKAVGQGSGLGLPQAYGFARQSGGTLTLRSQPGQGTVAELWLPRARQPALPAPVADGPPPASGEGRLLLVEDDDLVRDTVAASLELAGYQVTAAESADAALSLLEPGRFDLLLTDVVMPGTWNGVDLARHALRHHTGMGVVVASGYNDRNIQLPGAVALHKPYDTTQVVQALTQARQLARGPAEGLAEAPTPAPA